MKPPVETIRLGKQSRDQLVKIKRITGIENWNTVCRLAFAVSIREETCPPLEKSSRDDGIELTWKIFAGDYSEIFASLLNSDLIRHRLGNSELDPNGLLHAHLRRGLGFLASGSDIRSIEAFVEKWIQVEA